MVYNDGKLDRFGRLWVGTYELTEQHPRGILYCVTPDGTATIGDSGFPSCNGPAFSPDGRTMYFSDSVGRRILAYESRNDKKRNVGGDLLGELQSLQSITTRQREVGEHEIHAAVLKCRQKSRLGINSLDPAIHAVLLQPARDQLGIEDIILQM